MNKRYITPPTSIEIYFIISLRNEIIRFHVMTLNVLAIVLLLQNTYTTYWYEERYPDGKSISRVSAPRNSSCRTRNDIHGRRPEEYEQHRIEDIVYVFREICIHKLDVPWIDALGQQKYYSDNLKLIVSIANIDSLIMPPTLTQFYLVSIIACTR